MLVTLYLCLGTMNLLILYISFFFAPSCSISNTMLRQSFMQSNLSGWETCTSCKINKPSNIKDIKLEIQDVRDNVDFHFSHFEEQLKRHFLAIREGVDSSFTTKLDKSTEYVMEKLENLKAKIKINYKELAESVESNERIAKIDSKLQIVKQEIPKFTSNGLESFVDVFKHLKSEFTISDKGKKVYTDQKGKPVEETNVNAASKPDKEGSEGGSKGPVEAKKDAQEDGKIDLESVPPEAIIRTINSYLDDLKIEGTKLLKKVLFAKGDHES